MPIQVQDADGTIIEFPDGTPHGTIAGVMRRRDQEREARIRAAESAPGGTIGAMVAQAGNSAPPPPRRGEPRSLAQEVEQTLAAVNRGIPFAQDVVNFAGGLHAALSGGDFGQGMRQQNLRNQALTRDLRQRRPNAAAFAEGTGAALPVALSLGASSPVAAAQTARGLPLFAQQTGRAAATGAGTGALYGLGAGDAPSEGWAERLQSGNEGAMIGGAFGLAAPAAVNTFTAGANALRPAWRGLTDIARRVPTPEPNAVGAMGRPMRPPAPGPRSRPGGLPREAAGTVDRLADRAQMSPDQVESALARARAQPQGQVLADVFDEPGRQTTRALAQWPGRTGQRARDVARTRFAEAPGRIVDALRKGLNVNATRQQAMSRLADEYEAASANLYKPIWSRPLAPESRRALDTALQPYADDPVFQDAQRRANAIFARDRRNGFVEGAIDDHYARYLHYLKLGLDDAAQISANPAAGGVGRTELRGIRDMRARVIAAIDEHVPGYRDARAAWGGLREAEEALDEGEGFFTMLPDEVRARMAEMTPFQKMHARIGLVHSITGNMRGGRVVGQRNVANALDYRDTQDIIAAAFDDPAQAAAYLDGLNETNQLLRNAQTWTGGSSTAANAMYGADEALNTAGDMAGHIVTGRPGHAIMQGARGAINAATMGMVERANNVRGEALLTRVDSEDSAAFARAVVEELRRRQAARQAASRASQAAGAGAGASQGRRD